MRFVVAPEIFELFPGLKLSVAVAEDVSPSADAAGVEELWRQSWEDAARFASDHDNPQSHPRVAAWRAAMGEVGISVEGAGVPALPERGDDARVAHVNGLLRDVAAANTGRVAFVDGPGAWCDETVANDVAMRWDGVHVYQPGAALIYETITPTLLAL